MATPRFGKAEEIAGLVAWLAGPEARFVTGAAFTIDGGANASGGAENFRPNKVS
jgi:3-oxoacyl-[acyl-carrier protein] reductase